jgi:hypothetical protein
MASFRSNQAFRIAHQQGRLHLLATVEPAQALMGDKRVEGMKAMSTMEEIQGEQACWLSSSSASPLF